MARPVPTAAAKKPTDDIAATLFPAETVDVPIGNGVALQAEIYPFSFEHMQRFSGELVRISSIIERTVSLTITANTPAEKALEVIVASALPHVMSGLMPVVAECVTFTGEYVGLSLMSPRFPASVAGPIVKKWIEVNFSDLEKWRPWMDARKKAMEIYASAQPQTSETPSPSSHPPASG